MSNGTEQVEIPFDFLHPKESGDQKAIKMALLESQREFPNIPKNGKGKIQGRSKTGGEYNFEYSYAKFEDIMDAILPILNKNNILFSQKPFPCIADGNLYIITELEHVLSDGRRWVYFPVCDYSNVKQQEIGGNQTYAKRYSLVTLGIITEDDTDAQATEARTASRNKPYQKTKETYNTESTPYDPETGEVKEDPKVVAARLWKRALDRVVTYDSANKLAEEIDTLAQEGSITKEFSDILHKVVHARKMIMSSKTVKDIDDARQAFDDVPLRFRSVKDGGDLTEYLNEKQAEINATQVNA